MPALPFSDITYLRQGTPRQQQAYRVLTTHRVLDILFPYTPVLAGTIPLDIDIESSDLDILCYWKEADPFVDTLQQHWGHLSGFTLHRIQKNGQDTILVNFFLEEFELEVFGQNRPVHQQEAYRHLLRENEILRQRGPAFKEQIRELKKSGLKTEPAFAQLLGLTGDPYQAMLQVPR